MFHVKHRIEIVKAEYRHIETMLPDMRQADIEEVRAASGRTIEAALYRSVTCSTRAWTGLVDGVPILMWGAAPISILGGLGSAWLLGTNAIEQHQREFLRRGRRTLREMLRIYPTLCNAVDARNEVSIRWLRWLGFHVFDETFPVGPQRLPFRYFELRASDV